MKTIMALKSPFVAIGALLAGQLLISDVCCAHGEEHGGGDNLMSSQPRGSRKAKRKRFSFGVGIAYAEKFSTVETSGAPQDESAEVEHVHGPTEAADEPMTPSMTVAPHSHDHSLEHGFGASGAKFFTQAGYQFLRSWRAGAGVSASSGEGLDDVSTNLSYLNSLDKLWRARLGASATLPVSTESKELYKVTTVGTNASLGRSYRRWLFSSSAAVGVSVYDIPKGSEDSHSIEEASGGDHGAAGGEEGHAAGEHDREQVRYSAGAKVAYRVTRRFSAGSGIDLARTTWEKDDPTWLLATTLAQLSYQYEQIGSSLGLGLQGEDHAIRIPKVPLLRLLMQFSY